MRAFDHPEQALHASHHGMGFGRAAPVRDPPVRTGTPPVAQAGGHAAAAIDGRLGALMADTGAGRRA